jgi:D-alanyl-D-alanine carboxypeptidase
MRIASVSKAFSGAVALALVDDGWLSLDDTIGERLADLPPAWSDVTLRQALGHTGGLPSYTKNRDFLDYFGNNLHGRITKMGLIDFVAADDLDFPPGTRYEYSNTDNIVVALFAEAATGVSYERLLRSEVTRPLGLGSTELPSGWKLPAPRIHGYETLPAAEDLTTCCSMSFLSASGGISSSPEELTRFIRGYVGGRLFGQPARRAQFDFLAGAGSEPPGPGEQSGGLALFRYRTRCGTVFGHSGNLPGYTQFAIATRNGHRGLTFTVNRQLAPDAPGPLAPQAFRILRKDYAAAVCTLLGGR